VSITSVKTELQLIIMSGGQGLMKKFRIYWVNLTFSNQRSNHYFSSCDFLSRKPEGNPGKTLARIIKLN